MKYFCIIYCLGLVASDFVIAASTCSHPCKRSECKTPPDDCKGGLVVDRCACCMVCGKTLGDYCHGQFLISGRCESGLACVTKHKPYKPVHFQEQGICVPKRYQNTAEELNGPERSVEKKSKQAARKRSSIWSFLFS